MSLYDAGGGGGGWGGGGGGDFINVQDMILCIHCC